MREPRGLVFVPEPKGMRIELRSRRNRSTQFQTSGNASFLGTMPNGDLRFEEANWNERRTLIYRKQSDEWFFRSGGNAEPGHFNFEAERIGDARTPALVHYSRSSSIKSLRRPKLVIHFHGGPESIEFGERRYGNAFSSAVSEDHRYAAWNYPGSVGFGKGWTTLPHGNWEETILMEWINAESALMRRYLIPRKDWIFVGSSFGAMVALLIARFHPWVRKVVLASPLLSIRHQLDRVRRADPSQLAWFRTRFSEHDLDRLDFSSSLHELHASISIIASGRDEVLGTEILSRAIRAAQMAGKSIDLHVQRGCAHSPKRASSRQKREQLLRSAILD